MLRDWGVALSLANLIFLAAWSDQASIDFFLTGPPRWPALVGLLADVLLLAAVLVASVQAARRVRGRWGAWARAAVRLMFLAALIIPIDWVRRQRTTTSLDVATRMMSSPAMAGVVVILALIGLALLARTLKPVSQAAAWIVLALLPFSALTFATTLKRLVAPSVQLAAAGLSAKPPSTAQPVTRIVWLLFDELDERALFVSRDLSTTFPELDRLRSQSLTATNAYSPSRQTLWSLPALTVGRPVVAASVDGLDLFLHYGPGIESALWSRETTVFSDARHAGLATSIVGWYNSYCRVLAADLTRCFWESFRPEGDEDLTLAVSMVRPAVQVASQWPLTSRYGLDERFTPEWFDRSRRERHLETYTSVLHHAISEATGEPGLLFVHWPIPHTPVIYDRRQGDFAVRGNLGYLDNLALVDRTLGELRRAMEQAGTWDTATVIVTADHSWRKAPVEDYRIPFLLKLPGQSTSLEYSNAFNTTATRSLLQVIIAGEILRPEQAAAWLDQHRAAYPPSVVTSDADR